MNVPPALKRPAVMDCAAWLVSRKGPRPWRLGRLLEETDFSRGTVDRAVRRLELEGLAHRVTRVHGRPGGPVTHVWLQNTVAGWESVTLGDLVRRELMTEDRGRLLAAMVFARRGRV